MSDAARLEGSALVAAVALCAALAAPGAQAQKAHAHGAARLDAVVEGARLTLELEASLHDLVGFEHAPRDDRERAAIASMKAFLDSDRAFVPSPAAGCRRTGTTLETERRDGHADLRGAYAFACASPAALTALEVGLFGRFRRLARIDARVVSGKGQSAARLTPRKPTLAF
ncbi:MAG TPA: DUF2796 domain-containing protein [Myxococcota bacterium]|nr:DUF2796 domain-containing protein [Myxococcota bacterium]